MTAFRWLARNLGTLILAFILAVAVWVSATVTADPNEEHTLPAVPVQIVGRDPDLLLMSDLPAQASLTLEAPRSIWQQLEGNPELVRAWIDLSGLAPGEYVVPVNTQIDLSPTRNVRIDPADVHLVLEPVLARTFPVELIVNGDPPLGYKKDLPFASPKEVQISGPASAVERVAQVSITLDVSGASQTVKNTLPVEVLDENGAPVQGVTVNPKTVTVTEPISLLRGFKNVAVKVVTVGQVANGYRLTSVSVTPPTVTVTADDPQLLNDLPGYVETIPVDLTGLTDDVEVSAPLNLPAGVSLVREPSVLAQIGVAAIESSLRLSLPVEIFGLPPDFSAQVSPPSVDLIVAGPLPILETLAPASFRVVIDLTNLEPGIHQVTPFVDLVPERIKVEAMLPEKVQVTISLAPTPTPSVTPGTPAAPSGPTPAPTAAP